MAVSEPGPSLADAPPFGSTATMMVLSLMVNGGSIGGFSNNFFNFFSLNAMFSPSSAISPMISRRYSVVRLP